MKIKSLPLPVKILGAVGLGYWTYSLMQAKKLNLYSSTLFRGILNHAKSLESVQEELGTGITFDKDSIQGSINDIKGTGHITVDLIGSKTRGLLEFRGNKISPKEWKSEKFSLTLPNKKEILL